MTRRLEPVDLAVAVGVFATVLGAQFLWTAASGEIGGRTVAAVGEEQGSGITSAMQWLQPALGRSIVDKDVLGRTAAINTQAAAFQFVQAATSAERIGHSFQYLDGVITRAREADGDQAARVQHVLGRMIVSATLRGVRHDLVSATQPTGMYNLRLVGRAEAAADRMNTDFRSNREQNLGLAIVAASLGHLQAMDLNQERLGTAVVRLAQIQGSFETAAKAVEQQTGALTVAALRTEALAARLGQLAEAESLGSMEPVPYAGARALPEIPFSLIAAGSAAAILIFFVGLMVPSKNQEVGIAAGDEEKDASSYRRAG
jgi:hypothetical protein